MFTPSVACSNGQRNYNEAASTYDGQKQKAQTNDSMCEMQQKARKV